MATCTNAPKTDGTKETVGLLLAGDSGGAPPGMQGPDWDRIRFEVPCTRCGADLAGQSEPICPRCGVEFDWEVVLPLDHLRCRECSYQLCGLPEQTCPECGTPFQWSNALMEARARITRLFEFLWFDNPVPGFFRSYWLAVFRPRKLWALYDVNAPPKVVALLLFMLVQWLMFARGWQLIASLSDPAMNGLSAWLGSRLRFTYTFRPGAYFLPFMALSCIGTFGSLQLFFQTKHRLAIGWRETLRVYVHATTFASACTMGWCVLETLLDATLFFSPALGPISRAAYPMLAQAVFTLGLIVTWAHLWIGLRRCLGMSCGWGVAAASLVTGLLTGLLVLPWHLPF